MLRILKQIGGTIGLIGMIGYGFYQFEDHISQVKDGWFVMLMAIVILAFLVMIIIKILRQD